MLGSFIFREKREERRKEMLVAEEGFVKEHTLGGKAKEFLWRMEPGGAISIRRKFKNLGGKFVEQTISAAELKRLDEYMDDGNWKPLANDVAKLRRREEKDGIGRFFYEELGLDESGAQLASHVGAIFSSSGAWLHNGKKRGMEFKRNTGDWAGAVKDYYRKKLSAGNIS
jgi:hypothetical protein